MITLLYHIIHVAFFFFVLVYRVNNNAPHCEDTLCSIKDISFRFQHFEPQIDNKSLVAYWPLNEGSGYECVDWSGNSQTGFITGHNWNTTNSGLTSAFRKKGQRSGCVYLNGTQWIQVEHTQKLEVGDHFSITLWINPNELNDVELIKKFQDGKGFLLSLHQNGSFSFCLPGRNKEVLTVYSDSGVITPGIWQQIVVYTDAKRKLVYLIYNGQIINRFRNKSYKIDHSPTDLFIGGSKGTAACFNGLIDEVVLIKGKFNPDQIYKQYITGLPSLYTQTRETIDDSLKIWNFYHGNHPVPHPRDSTGVMILRFDGNLFSLQGQKSLNDLQPIYVPGEFGGAWLAQQARCGLNYKSPFRTNSGSFESWIKILEDHQIPSPLIALIGNHNTLELRIATDTAVILLASKQTGIDSMKVALPELRLGDLIHVALSWFPNDIGSTICLFLNGVEKANKSYNAYLEFNNQIWIGGNSTENFIGLIDDVCFSSQPRKWGEICPRGQIDTESSSLDLRQGFDDSRTGSLMHWMSTSNSWSRSNKVWDVNSERECIRQSETIGLRTLFHPDAYGFNSSFESMVATDVIHGGWIGVFVQSPGPEEENFSGNAFLIKPGTDQIRLVTFRNGEIMKEKVLRNDYFFESASNYCITLSSVNSTLRGYIDQRNVISMKGIRDMNKGYAGLITLNEVAYFDDIHFSAITPNTKKSRRIETRVIPQDNRITLRNYSLNAFRWKKRYGLLPWERDYKNPEPPGNIFGPDNQTPRPNRSAAWRSEDAANSAIIHANGTFYYLMRGNPDIDGLHGNAQIGVLWCDDRDFDGIHFTDPNVTGEQGDAIHILVGHPDTNKGGCSDEPPRNKQFQLNDQGGVFLDGKILMLCREFRNANERSNRFRRLVLGIYDTEKKSWTSEVPNLLDWSYNNPDSCFSNLQGINATPEITMIRDPESDDFIILLYHHGVQNRPGGYGGSPSFEGSRNYVRGFTFEGITLKEHAEYNHLPAVQKSGKVGIFGERVLFDNGIWYMHINAHSKGLIRDWPDCFELYSSLDPYRGPWISGGDNERPYFERGSEFDPDNGAIWQGEMLKYRNRYYMYYENYHVIENPEEMYEYYNHPESGSRVGFAVAN